MKNFKQDTSIMKSTAAISNVNNPYSANVNNKRKWASDYRNNKATKYYKYSSRLMLILMPLCIAVTLFLCVGFIVEVHPVVWGLNWMVFTGIILLIIWTMSIISTYFILRKIYLNERYSYGYAELLKSQISNSNKKHGSVKKTNNSESKDAIL